MKASDKLRNEIKLKEIQISEIQSEVEKRNTFLQTKTIHSVLAKTKYPFLPVYYGHKYYLHGKEIPKAEFDKVLSELNELHKTDYETIKLLNHEIKLLEGALEQALFEEASNWSDGNINLKQNLVKTSRKKIRRNTKKKSFHQIIDNIIENKNLLGDNKFKEQKYLAEAGNVSVTWICNKFKRKDFSQLLYNRLFTEMKLVNDKNEDLRQFFSDFLIHLITVKPYLKNYASAKFKNNKTINIERLKEQNHSDLLRETNDSIDEIDI